MKLVAGRGLLLLNDEIRKETNVTADGSRCYYTLIINLSYPS